MTTNGGNSTTEAGLNAFVLVVVFVVSSCQGWGRGFESRRPLQESSQQPFSVAQGSSSVTGRDPPSVRQFGFTALEDVDGSPVPRALVAATVNVYVVAD